MRAHPLSNAENAQELNPQLTGNSSMKDVSHRFFFDSTVGVGEEVFDSVCYNFAHNQRKFFLLKMKKVIDEHIPSQHMFQKVHSYTPTIYKPEAPSLTGSEVSEDFFYASFSKGEKKVLDALSKARVHKHLVPDPERVWSNFATFQLYSPEEKFSSDFIRKILHPPSDSKNSEVCVGKYFCV